MSLYIVNFLLAFKFSNSIEWIKQCLKSKYNVKNLGKIKTIIGWQVIRNIKASILKIDQFAFIQGLFKEKNLSNCNSINIPMKADSVIKMNNTDDYKKTNIKA